jgi:murein L,D-transpeptidase YcbB/YkuD
MLVTVNDLLITRVIPVHLCYWTVYSDDNDEEFVAVTTKGVANV